VPAAQLILGYWLPQDGSNIAAAVRLLTPESRHAPNNGGGSTARSTIIPAGLDGRHITIKITSETGRLT
jgi:hypothetical protein